MFSVICRIAVVETLHLLNDKKFFLQDGQV